MKTTSRFLISDASFKWLLTWSYRVVLLIPRDCVSFFYRCLKILRFILMILRLVENWFFLWILRIFFRFVIFVVSVKRTSIRFGLSVVLLSLILFLLLLALASFFILTTWWLVKFVMLTLTHSSSELLINFLLKSKNGILIRLIF